MYVLISALKRILVTSDFKTAKTVFLKELTKTFSPKESEEKIDGYFKKFKEAKDRNKITNLDEKNIDFWAKKPFADFQKFVDQLMDTPTRTEVKKQPWKEKVENTEKITENEEWVVFRVYDFEAAQVLGTRNWCIVRNEDYWYEYSYGGYGTYPECPNYFYFALSKTRNYGIEHSGEDITYIDPFHKIAFQVSPSDVKSFNAHDERIRNTTDNMGKELNLPVIQFDHPIMCDRCRRNIDICEGECCPVCGNIDGCDCCKQCMNIRHECDCCKKCGKTLEECDCCKKCGKPIEDCNCCRICDSIDSDECGCCFDYENIEEIED